MIHLNHRLWRWVDSLLLRDLETTRLVVAHLKNQDVVLFLISVLTFLQFLMLDVQACDKDQQASANVVGANIHSNW